MDEVDVQELANSLIKEYGEPGDDELVINTSTLDLEGLVKYINEDTASTPPGITPVIDLEEEEKKDVGEKEKNPSPSPRKKARKSVQPPSGAYIVKEQKKHHHPPQQKKMTAQIRRDKLHPPPPPPKSYYTYKRKDVIDSRVNRPENPKMEEIPTEFWSRREDLGIYLSCCRDYNTRGYRLENIILHIMKVW